MIKEGKFGTYEAVCLVSVAICNKLFFTSPGYLSRFVGNAGWYMTIISALTAVAAFSLICLLFRQYPGKNMIDIFELTLGRVVGFVFSILFASSFLMTAGIMTREFVDVMKVFVLPETPSLVLVIAVLFAVCCSTFLGLETIARVSKIFAFIILSAFVIVLVLNIREYETTNLFPILGYGLDKTVVNGLKRSSAYLEVMVLTVFAGSLQGTKYLKKAGLLSLLISGGIIAVSILCFSLAFPVEELQELTAPMFSLTRLINYGEFFQRLDPIFVFTWIISTLITASVLFYSSASCYCKIFRIDDTRPVILPMIVVLLAVIMLPKNFQEIASGIVQVSRDYGWIIAFAMPVFCLIVSGLKKLMGYPKTDTGSHGSPGDGAGPASLPDSD